MQVVGCLTLAPLRDPDRPTYAGSTCSHRCHFAIFYYFSAIIFYSGPQEVLSDKYSPNGTSMTALQPWTFQSINNYFLLQLLIMHEKALEQIDGMLDVMCSASLSDAVHAQLRISEV